jgi:hypothetical protein
VHGRRQFVPQGVLLSQITNKTLTPNCHLHLRVWSTLGGPLALSQRKGRSTVGPYAPNFPGYTRNTKGGTMGFRHRKVEVIPKPVRSSDRGL